MDIVTQLNEQAEKVCKELVQAKKQAKQEKAARNHTKAAYHKGRAEELDKWLASLENMITAIVERRGRENGRN